MTSPQNFSQEPKLNLDIHDTIEEIPVPSYIVEVLTVAKINGQESKIVAYRCCCLLDIQFTTLQASQRNCYVFFRDRKLMNLGRMNLILGVMLANRREYFVAVQRNLPILEGMEDPFWPYTDFRASL